LNIEWVLKTLDKTGVSRGLVDMTFIGEEAVATPLLPV
jgi:hypothetical protein